MSDLDLNCIYDQLKDRYPLRLCDSFDLDAGFRIDCPVLYGQSDIAKFYLYHDGTLSIFDIEKLDGSAGDHTHPEDTAEALEDVVAFMDGRYEFDWWPDTPPERSVPGVICWDLNCSLSFSLPHATVGRGYDRADPVAMLIRLDYA